MKRNRLTEKRSKMKRNKKKIKMKEKKKKRVKIMDRENEWNTRVSVMTELGWKKEHNRKKGVKIMGGIKREKKLNKKKIVGERERKN